MGGKNKSFTGGGASKASGGAYGKNGPDAKNYPPRLGKSALGVPAPVTGAPEGGKTWPGDNPSPGGVDTPTISRDGAPMPSGYRGPGSSLDPT